MKPQELVKIKNDFLESYKNDLLESINDNFNNIPIFELIKDFVLYYIHENNLSMSNNDYENICRLIRIRLKVVYE